MEGRMFLLQKKSGEVKDMFTYNGKTTTDWIVRDEKSIPTTLTEIIILTARLETKEERDVASMDVPNAFIQAHIPLNPVGEQIVMKVIIVLVDWLIELDPVAYSKYVVYENGKNVLHLEVLRAIYRMLVASLLWYRKLRKDLEAIGFKFNKYNPYVVNRT